VKTCPNCGASVEASVRRCPNCGIEMRTLPPPGSSPRRPKLLTGQARTDFLLGAAVQYLLHLAAARMLVKGMSAPNPADPQHGVEVFDAAVMVVGEIFWAVVFGLLYFNVHSAYPVVARGSGYATLALLVVLLGALFTCQPVLY